MDEIWYLVKLFKIATISIDAFVDTSKWTVKFDYFYSMDYSWFDMMKRNNDHDIIFTFIYDKVVLTVSVRF